VKIDEIAKLMQVFMLQNLYSNNTEGAGQTSLMFEMLLQAMMKDMSSQSAAYSVPQSTENPSLNNDAENNKKLNLQNTSSDIMGAIRYASQKYGVEEELIKAVIKQESGFNPRAVSHAGAQGLMQLMPQTARSLGVENPFNVLDNIDGGTRYLKRLIDAFGGNEKLALAAYNGGIGRMKRLGVDTVEEISKMPNETRNYVARVMRNYENYKKA
jgi:soluble lytic murein transglycosylase-like protein